MREKAMGALPAIVGWLLIATLLAVGWRTFEPVRVSGLSMHPALHAGDLVLVERSTRARRGEIALVRARGHGPFLHRVISARASRLRTKGDANLVPDFEQVTPDATRRVAAVLPVGRYLEWWRARVPCAKLTAQSNSERR